MKPMMAVSGFMIGVVVKSFSWGDSRINDCSKRLFKGNLGGWVAIDRNHHLQFVLFDVLEFERMRSKDTSSLKSVSS